MVRAKLNERIKELETELKDIKQQLDDASRNKDEEVWNRFGIGFFQQCKILFGIFRTIYQWRNVNVLPE